MPLRIGHFQILGISPFLALLGSIAVIASGQGYTIQPASLTYRSGTVGIPGQVLNVQVRNDGHGPVTVSAISISSPEFVVTAGEFPRLISVGSGFSYSIQYMPATVGTATGTATFTINNAPVQIPLSGTAFTTGAIASLNTTSMTFGNRPLGTSSAAQTLTITNTGTTAVSVTAIATAPPFGVAGFTLPATLQPGNSVSGHVTFWGMSLGTATGQVNVVSDVLRPSGVSLTGTAIAPKVLGIATYPVLPLGTAGYPYLATLQSAGGTGSVTYSLKAHSVLPPGLTLSSTGTISGTISSTANLSTYKFVVVASDSLSNQAASTLSLQVLKTTGAACNNIVSNIANTTSPLVAITDLGTGTYVGAEEGGLYLTGSNTMPAGHQAAGVALAQSIQPLDASGNPDPNGKYALIGFGISVMQYTMDAFQPLAMAEPTRNPHLVVVNGGEPSAQASDFSQIASPFWNTLTNYLLPNNGVTANQVVAVFFEDLDIHPSGTFPSDMTAIQTEFEAVAQNVHTIFPNAHLMYFQSRMYSGYSTTTTDPEPYAYEIGFAMKNAIIDQLKGLASLNFDSTKGPVMAPWLGFGFYDWSNGMLGRQQDSFVYTCQDVQADGHHPSTQYGAPKRANFWLNFFKTDPTTAPWFVKH